MHPIDWLILIVYLVGSLLVGLWLARRNRSEDDYFVADCFSGLTKNIIPLFASFFQQRFTICLHRGHLLACFISFIQRSLNSFFSLLKTI